MIYHAPVPFVAELGPQRLELTVRANSDNCGRMQRGAAIKTPTTDQNHRQQATHATHLGLGALRCWRMETIVYPGEECHVFQGRGVFVQVDGRLVAAAVLAVVVVVVMVVAFVPAAAAIFVEAAFTPAAGMR